MFDNPIITIFIVTYNQEDTIERTIKSVVEQKISYPYIIHILDDCSTDNTSNICKQYERLYPDIVKVTIEPSNTKCDNSRRELSIITTKYWAIVEGDDYWCDENRIQRALDFLEKNEKYVGYATDYLVQTKEKSFSGAESTGVDLDSLNNEIHMNSGLYIHTAARVLRNIVDFKPLIHHKCFGDALQWAVYLDKGPIYFDKRITSVYNLCGSGMWTNYSEQEKLYRNEVLSYELNKLFNFRHDYIFSISISEKEFLIKLKERWGKRVGWSIYILSRYINFNISKFFKANS
jgi:glycosyltransferase involved in cell wall biosynthesis